MIIHGLRLSLAPILLTIVVGICLLAYNDTTLVFPHNHFVDPADASFDSNNEPIQRVVLRYCDLAKKEDIAGIKTLITYTPADYWQYRLEHIHSETHNSSQTVEGVTPHEEQVRAADSTNTGMDSLNYRQLTENTVLAFRNLKVPARIEGTLINGEYGKVRAIFEADIPLPAPLRYDFFLLRRNQEWKIFMVSLARESDKYPM
jgi:hypothetical protein